MLVVTFGSILNLGGLNNMFTNLENLNIRVFHSIPRYSLHNHLLVFGVTNKRPQHIPECCPETASAPVLPLGSTSAKVVYSRGRVLRTSFRKNFEKISKIDRVLSTST